MDDETRRENQRRYELTRAELHATKLSNYQTYDRTIISTSGVIVAASVAFFTSHLKINGWLAVPLILSWVSLTLSIVAVLRSLYLGNKGSDAMLLRAQECFQEDKDESELSESDQALIDKTEWWNLCSGIALAMGVVLTILFASLFIIGKARGGDMSKHTRLTEGAPPSSPMKKIQTGKTVSVQDGAPPTTLQKKATPPAKVAPKPEK